MINPWSRSETDICTHLSSSSLLHIRRTVLFGTKDGDLATVDCRSHQAGAALDLHECHARKINTISLDAGNEHVREG